MYLIELILLAYFGYVSLYAALLSTAGLFYRPVVAPPATTYRRIAVLIPAYKEDGVICQVAKEALKQTYPTDRFDVVVIADSLQAETMQRLAELPIQLVPVSFEKSTKVKAINRAMELIGDDYDCALVLDADNVMDEHFLEAMNNLFALGYRAVQGRRCPKNENNSMALLDGLSESINNYIYRQGNAALGLSCPLIGSGMIFDYPTFKTILQGMDSVGGFDRELELKLLDRGNAVLYARDVIVFDEKVANAEVFENQRKRWISSHFFYLRKYFAAGWRALFRGNFDYFNSAILRNLQLPRLLNLGLLTGVLAVSLIIPSQFTIKPAVWAALLLIHLGAIALAIPRRAYNRNLLRSIFLVPKLFVRMLMLMFKLKGANKRFLHTPHGGVEINIEKRP
jgi:cellulose synthase/poly-beta-1,6-N-acetylglucosamine synthase-like glycosyltransferase